MSKPKLEAEKALLEANLPMTGPIMNMGGVGFKFVPRRDGEAPMDPVQFERELYSALEQEYPDLWRVCYPRIYHDPKCGQYHSSKKPARQMMLITLKMLTGQVKESEKYEFHLASQLARFRVPTYWLSESITEALKLTTPPGKIDWYEMPLPFDAGVFMLPKGSLVHPTDGDVTFLAYARFRAQSVNLSPLVPGREFITYNGSMILACAVEKGYFLHWTIPRHAYGDSISLVELQELMTKYKGDEHQSALPVGGLTEDDHTVGLQVAHYVFSTLLLMTARPDLVTTASMTNRLPAKKNTAPKEFWSPAIIGEHYKTRHEAGPSQGGTHASPRFHWVKGFWREQPYGPREQHLRKSIWVEPFSRGGSE